MVNLDIPEENLEKLKDLAKSYRMSRKAYMEYILIEHSKTMPSVQKLSEEILKSQSKTDQQIFQELVSKKLVAAEIEVTDEIEVSKVFNTAINQQIKSIENERIPVERNTKLGRQVWYKEQRERINQLKSKLR